MPPHPVLPMLLGTYSETMLNTSSAWYVSEKYDGWRMMYRNGCFVSRTGRVLAVPSAMRDEIGAFEDGETRDLVLDGELWMGYGTLNDIPAALSNGDGALKLMVFDIPSHDGTFQERHEKLCEMKIRFGSSVRLVEQHRVDPADTERIDEIYKEVLGRKGEGIVVKPHDLPYSYGKRCDAFMKRKPWDTLEVRVVAHHTTAAKRTESSMGYVSSLVCEHDGKQFKVSVKTYTPPAIGSTVEVRYSQQTTTGLPKYPCLVRKADAGPSKVAEAQAVVAVEVQAPEALKTTHEWAGQKGYALANGEKVLVRSDTSDEVYSVARARQGDSVYCSCPAWKYQRSNPRCRTCKHCEAVCGKKAEAIRVARATLELLEM
jgi:DNA ligase 1